MLTQMDEIAIIAQDYFDRHKAHAFALIDNQISIALGQSQWDKALKWHRVRHRLRRIQMLYAGGKAKHLVH